MIVTEISGGPGAPRPDSPPRQTGECFDALRFHLAALYRPEVVDAVFARYGGPAPFVRLLETGRDATKLDSMVGRPDRDDSDPGASRLLAAFARRLAKPIWSEWL